MAMYLQDASHGLWPSAYSQQGFPSRQGKLSPWAAGTRNGHIWCYIPLCTIFAQKSNGKIFKTPFPHFTSHHQHTIPFQRKSLVAEACNSWEDPEDHLREPITWHFRFWPFQFNSIPPREYLHRILPGKFQEVVIHQISFKSIKSSSTPSTTQLAHKGCIHETCMAWTLLDQFVFHCGNSRHTVQFSKWPDL
ncbi:hypothetical protein O181_017829 [Austropuccinia psidii MF-1]|uniref:Uncharacterized protein n=1 Tax=Austropuccinia psidii MF-1 TaxID=1389203 RepID=A0A9Q3C6G2_9BASI|nr:hypothetical protein [Austropuccinia psidii MF-1]